MKAYKKVFNQVPDKQEQVRTEPKRFSPEQEKRVDFIRNIIAKAKE